MSLYSGRRDELVHHVLGDPESVESQPCIGTPARLAETFDDMRNLVSPTREDSAIGKNESTMLKNEELAIHRKVIISWPCTDQ